MGAIATKELGRRRGGIVGGWGGRREVGRAGVLGLKGGWRGCGRSGGVVDGWRLGAIAAKEMGRKGVGLRGDWEGGGR